MGGFGVHPVGLYPRKSAAALLDLGVDAKIYGATGSAASTTGTMSAGSTSLSVTGTLPTGADAFLDGQHITVAGAAQIADPSAALTLSQAAGSSSFTASDTVYVTYAWVDPSNNMTKVAPAASIAISAAGNTVAASVTLPNFARLALFVGTASDPLLLATIDMLAGAGPAATQHIAYSGSATSGVDVSVSGRTMSLTISGAASATGTAEPTSNTTAVPLVTTISSGAGGTSWSLADAATNAVTNGTISHDDTNALTTAWNALGTHAWGTLVIPEGTYNISSTLDFNGGYSGAGTYRDNLNTTGAHVNIVCQGTLTLAAGIGPGVNIHSMYNLNASLNFIGGGLWGDCAVQLADIAGLDYEINATKYAGTVLLHDSSNGGYVAQANGGKLYTNECGAPLDYRNGNSYGTITSVWETNSAYGSVFNATDDITLVHYENYTAQTTSASLRIYNSGVKAGVIALGNGSTPLLQIDGNASQALIDTVLLDGVGSPTGAIGVDILDDAVVSIGKMTSGGHTTALNINGSGEIWIGLHKDTSSANAVVFNGSSATTIGKIVYASNTGAAIVASQGYAKILSGEIIGANASGSTNTAVNVNTGLLWMQNVSWSGDASGTLDFTSPGADQIFMSHCTHQNGVYYSEGPVSTATLTSGTAVQNTYRCSLRIIVPVTYNPTSTAAATAQWAVGASTSSLSSLPEESEPAGLTTGRIRNTEIVVRKGWYYQLTVANATIGTATTILENER